MLLALAAFSALVLGMFVYLLDRHPESAYFLSADWSLAKTHSSFGSIGDVLPSFAHAFAFSLITALILASSHRGALFACATWWVIDSLFEIGQLPSLAPHIAVSLPSWLGGIPFVENTAAYFLHGTFDAWDLAAIAAGAIGAYCMIVCSGQVSREGGASWANTQWRRASRWLGFWLITATGLFAVVGSGGGGGGGDDTLPATNVWLLIEEPSPGTVLDTSAVDLFGRAYCPECPPPEVGLGYCPAISCPSSTEIGVSWRNQTNGASGDASHGIVPRCSCLFSYCTSSCQHRWSASVPLAMGPNAIAVTASDMTGSFDSDSISISRVPPAPAGVVAAAEHNQVTISWNSVPEATSYNIYWSTSRTISKDTATVITGVTSPYTQTGLIDDVTYYYLVTAVTGGYEGFVSDVAWATAGWLTEAVAVTTSTTNQRDTSIDVDSARNPHVHYSYNEHVEPSSVYQYNYYTTKAAGTWNSVLVDTTSSVNANLVLDSSDIVHVGYLDFPGLTHAVYASGAWTAEVVDPQAECNAALVLDSADKAHAAYRAGSGSGDILRYANNTSGGWVVGVVDTFTSLGCVLSGNRVSLAVDAAGVAHIAYAGDYPDYGLKYATNQGGVWSTSIVDDGYIEQVSLAVEANGNVHIVYADNVSRLRYANNISGAWVVELLEDDGTPRYPSIAIDADGTAHISYLHDRYGELRYATNPFGVWSTIPVAAVGSVPFNAGADTAIAVDSLGKVYVSYFNGGSLEFTTNK